VLRAIGLMLVALAQTTVRRLRHGPPRPTWSFTFQLVQRYMRLDWDATADWDLPRLREEMSRRPYPRKYAKRALSRDDSLGGVPVHVYTPRERRGDGVVLYFHGGSFIYGSATTTHADLLARLALETGVEVFGVEYRLAPEHPFPAQLEDAVASFDALVAKGVAADRVVVAGDSSGGNLAVEAAIALRDRGGPSPRALVLLSPWADLAMPGASFRENAALDFGTREVLVRHAAAYAGAVALDDPRVSPIHADLRGLPPTFVSRGACEIPRDDIAAFTDALVAAGVRVTTHEAADLPHNPAFFADFHPSGLASFEAAVHFVGEQLA
jgi:monoterpene epsilon-lactone hydrolase